MNPEVVALLEHASKWRGISPPVRSAYQCFRCMHFDRYNIVSEGDLRDAIKKTAAYVDSRRRSAPSVTPLPGSEQTSR